MIKCNRRWQLRVRMLKQWEKLNFMRWQGKANTPPISNRSNWWQQKESQNLFCTCLKNAAQKHSVTNIPKHLTSSKNSTVSRYICDLYVIKLWHTYKCDICESPHLKLLRGKTPALSRCSHSCRASFLRRLTGPLSFRGSHCSTCASMFAEAQS